MRTLLYTILFASSLFVPALQAQTPAKSQDNLSFPEPGVVHLQGWIGNEISTCKQGRLLGQHLPDLITPFAVREEDKMWRSEFWGKWFTSAALGYRYDPDPQLREVLNQALKGLLATQTPDGAITTYKKEAEFSNWDTWGRKYTLLGLLAYHEQTGDTNALAAARRHADRVIEHFSTHGIQTNGWWTGMAASSILEPMVLLYGATGEERYLAFAKSIVQSWTAPGGPDLLGKALTNTAVFQMFPGPDPKLEGYMSGGSSKAYEMMSCFEGLIELYRVTGESNYLQAAKNVFDSIRETEITVLSSGSSWERWCNGRFRQVDAVPEWMETCVTVTWLKLAGQLLRATGDPQYAEALERSAYNPLLAAQKADGTWWCHYNPLLGQREAAPEHCNMHQNCCVANGPRGLMYLPMYAFMQSPQGPVVNLYESGTAQMKSAAGKPVKLEIQGDFPRSGKIRIKVEPSGLDTFTLKLRIPAWSRNTRLSINGHKVKNFLPGTYAGLHRAWRAGDRIDLDLDMTTYVESDPSGSGQLAVLRGPIVFALDRRLLKSQAGTASLRPTSDGTLKARLVESNDRDFRVLLDVPVQTGSKTAMLRMCDYASAGRTWSTNSTLRVWLPKNLDLSRPFEDQAPAAK